ncbi:MAG: serine/threonine-protein kinase [Acidobacteria bacterium]|nr:serine/threonine-protein kinase [Acidobacteriota bacterium]
MLGKSLTHYEVLEKLGEGGMGVVYKARDIRLNRLAALKVLPPDKMADEGRRARFIQEAQAASALNHPNIVTIYEIDRDSGSDFIAMEFISGHTLDAVIGRHGLKLSETLKYAIQIADALSAAHAAGIVHRDLKPGNVMVTEKGQVKILDFGLAKLTEAPDPSDAATRTLQPAPLTEQGAVLGTVAYMSPEQAEGRKVDARSDIFSFGSLLYEMTTGQRAFSGDSRMSTIMAILRDDPKPVSQAGESVPRDLEKIIARCLRKDLARRFQHIDDVKVALEELKEESDSGALAGSASAPARKNPRGLAVAIGGIVLVGLVALLAVWLRRGREPAPTLTLTPLTSYPGSEERPSFSPDGNQVAFSWNGEKEDNFDIYVKLVGGGTPLRLTTNTAVDGVPAWSPDGRQIAFLRNPGEAAVVYLISPLGGPERRLCDAKGDALAWTPDGKSLAIMDRATDREPYAIALVAVDTGEKRRLSRPPPESVGDVPYAFSPDGQELVFARWPHAAVNDLFVLSLKGGDPRRLTAERREISGVAWLPSGSEVLFSRGGALWRMRATPGAIPKSL